MNTLIIMAKAPVMGATKTRLARGTSAAEAIRAYRAMLSLVLRRVTDPRRWRVVLAVTPDHALATPALGRYDRVAQGRGDLGQRMQRLIDRFRLTSRVLIIGSDIPGVTQGHIASAFAALAGHDAVIGPAPDGGYWLIGLGRCRRVAPFKDVRWSGPFARSDTLSGLRGLRVAMLATLPDADDAASWRAWTALPASARFRGSFTRC